MRYRTYDVLGKLPKHMTETQTRYKSDGSGGVQQPYPWAVNIYSGLTPTTFLRGSGSMTDMVNLVKQGRFEVHPCTHQKVKVDWVGTSGATATIELQSSNQLHSWVFQQHSPNSYATNFLSNRLTKSAIEGVNPADYTTGSYVDPDWFALLDSFREACDSFIPSNLLLGETLIEYGIFADIVKVAINPTRIIPSFIKMVKDYGLEKSNLGKIRRTLRHASRGTLSYSFAVKPAIQDLQSIFSAHRKVSKRFDYLIKNGGAYVPVRVKKNFYSSIANSDISQSGVLNQTVRKQCRDKYVTAAAGCWGRVREDLNHSDAWKAYVQYFGLNKVVGLAWELVPFSFVLDWFTNVQERINYLTRFSTGSAFTEFRGMTFSRKQTTLESMYLVPGYNSVIGGYMKSPNTPMAILNIEKSNYERYLTIPTTSGVVDTSTLGLFHSITGGALLIQRFLR